MKNEMTKEVALGILKKFRVQRGGTSKISPELVLLAMDKATEELRVSVEAKQNENKEKEDLLRQAFRAGRNFGHALGTGIPSYVQTFDQWYSEHKGDAAAHKASARPLKCGNDNLPCALDTKHGILCCCECDWSE